jgi:tetratricopeptide (TPR) repeat protein
MQRTYVLAFRPSSVAYIYVPEASNEVDVEGIRSDLSRNSSEMWSVEIFRDLEDFRQASRTAVIGLVDPDGFGDLDPKLAGKGTPLLKPIGARDMAYHAALLTLSQPGFLRFDVGSTGVTEAQIDEQLAEARRFQIAISFEEAFTDADVTDLNPIATVEQLFPPACFDTPTLELLDILVEDAAKKGDATALDAALAAAASLAGRRTGRGLELARGLVRHLLSGGSLKQDSAIWSSLLDAEEVFRALAAEGVSYRTRADMDRLTAIAQALGHGERVLELLSDRMWSDPQDPEELVDALLGKLEEGQADDLQAGRVLAMIAGSKQAEQRRRGVALVLDRVGATRPLWAVPIVRDVAARFTAEGEPAVALQILDDAERRIAWDRVPHQASIARASLWNERGNALRAELRYDEALAAYRHAQDTQITDLTHDHVRVVRLNEARTLRDAGRLSEAIRTFEEILPYTEGRERFDCLFAIAIARQREGQWEEAQRLLDEASQLVESAPVDDQLARFAMVRAANARALGTRAGYSLSSLFEAVQRSPLMTARMRLLTLGALSVAGLRSSKASERLRSTTRTMARNMDLVDRAGEDPEFALTWADAARLAGDRELGRQVVQTVLVDHRQPILAMHAACIAAHMAIEDGDWPQAAATVEQTAEHTVQLVAAAAAGSDTVSIADTLGEVRDLGRVLADAPVGPRYDALLSMVADLQCSLQLSLRLAGELVPSGAAPQAVRTSLQILQWLDAGDVQLPLLTDLGGNKAATRRGAPLVTELTTRLGARIAGRVGRSPALSPNDHIEELAPYRAFRDALAAAIEPLGLEEDRPLVIVPSAALIGIPLHHALARLDVAYSPSLSVTVALARRVLEGQPELAAIGEVRCECFGDEQAIVTALEGGASRLQSMCEAHHVSYRCISGVEATRDHVAMLLELVGLLKLSCHGITDAARARFALVLSDGRQQPPPLSELVSRVDLAERYLFEWSQIASTTSRCRAVFSSACTSGSATTTAGGEQLGLARAYLTSGVLSFIAPLWPVAAAPAQEFVNTLIDRCLAEPAVALATQLRRTREEVSHLPPRVRDAFVLHGHAGPLAATHQGAAQ